MKQMWTKSQLSGFTGICNLWGDLTSCTVSSQVFGIQTSCSQSTWTWVTTQKWVSLTHPPTVAQITLRYIKITLSVTEVDCFHALWNKSLLQSFTTVHASKTCLYFSKKKCSYFLCLFRLSYTFITVISLIPATKQAIYIENGFQGPCFITLN
jgi:hypothetical protein